MYYVIFDTIFKGLYNNQDIKEIKTKMNNFYNKKLPSNAKIYKYSSYEEAFKAYNSHILLTNHTNKLIGIKKRKENSKLKTFKTLSPIEMPRTKDIDNNTSISFFQVPNILHLYLKPIPQLKSVVIILFDENNIQPKYQELFTLNRLEKPTEELKEQFQMSSNPEDTLTLLLLIKAFTFFTNTILPTLNLPYKSIYLSEPILGHMLTLNRINYFTKSQREFPLKPDWLNLFKSFKKSNIKIIYVTNPTYLNRLDKKYYKLHNLIIPLLIENKTILTTINETFLNKLLTKWRSIDGTTGT